MERVILVTAGSRGIGAAICRKAGSEGYKVAVNYNQSPAEAEKVVADIRKAGGEAVAVRADVMKESDIVAMFAEIDRRLGPVTALVNNAGGGKVVLGPDGCTTADATQAKIEAVMALNFTSTVLCTREAILRMSTKRGGKGGAIVNISSDCARRGGPTSRKNGVPGLVLYAAAKAAVDGFSLNVAVEVAPEGIRVNVIRPATIMTPAHDVDGADHYANMAKLIPLNRPGRPEEIADFALFLLSEKAGFATAAFVDVTGGR
jgi:NAD(P)-dependent dehydrogenase (short-subunit alcohol dehydrogenase family)